MTRAAIAAGLAGVLAACAAAELSAAFAEARRGARARRGTRGVLALLGGLGRRLGRLAPPADLADRLAAAGVAPRVKPGDLMAMKGGAALAGLVFALPLAAASPGRLAWLVAVAGPLAGFLAPDWWLRRRARARGRAMDAELPDLLALFVVALEAGLPLSRALGEVGRRADGPLAREWRGAAEEAACGIPLDRALEDLGRRCPPRPCRARRRPAARRPSRRAAGRHTRRPRRRGPRGAGAAPARGGRTRGAEDPARGRARTRAVRAAAGRGGARIGAAALSGTRAAAAVVRAPPWRGNNAPVRLAPIALLAALHFRHRYGASADYWASARRHSSAGWGRPGRGRRR